MDRKIVKIVIVLGIIFFFQSIRLQAEEIPTPYQIKYEKLSKDKEYYIEAPEIEIEHFDEKLVTKYRMMFSDGKELTGKLDIKENKVLIQAELFTEGEHELEVWMENQEGEKIEGTDTVKIFKIDKTAPNEPLEFIYQKDSESEILCFSDKTNIKIKASDSISGIQGIYYQLNEEEEKFMEGEAVTIELPLGFEGAVSAYAIDYAGNRGKWCTSKTFICENEAAEITMKASEGFEHWYNEPFSVEVMVRENGVQSGIKNIVCYVNGEKVKEDTYELKTEEETFLLPVNAMTVLGIETEDYAGNKSVKREQILFDNQCPKIDVSGIENYMITSDTISLSCFMSDEHKITSIEGKIVWANVDGMEKTIEIEDWKKDGETYYAEEELGEDGVYQLDFKVQDQAGNQNEKKLQIIVDKANPVISRVEELQGRYLQFFEWNYEQEEVIQDFTTYTYAINLDNHMCEPNFRYMQEGKHILEVTAKDAAENMSTANAEFIIDHTAPKIIFKNIEEGKIYENEVEALISLENENDIIETIYVDGIMQKLDSASKEFQYLFQKPGDHSMKVTANDLAGNKKEEIIKFTLEEKNHFLER